MLFWFKIFIHIVDIGYTFTSLLNLPWYTCVKLLKHAVQVIKVNLTLLDYLLNLDIIAIYDWF